MKKNYIETEIQSRIDSDSWDMNMAFKVLNKRKKNFQIKMSMAATAAVAVIVVSVVIVLQFSNESAKTQVQTTEYELITHQVEGTYNNVYAVKSNSLAKTAYYQNGVYQSDEIDTLIEETLYKRLVKK